MEVKKTPTDEIIPADTCADRGGGVGWVGQGGRDIPSRIQTYYHRHRTPPHPKPWPFCIRAWFLTAKYWFSAFVAFRYTHYKNCAIRQISVVCQKKCEPNGKQEQRYSIFFYSECLGTMAWNIEIKVWETAAHANQNYSFIYITTLPKGDL